VIARLRAALATFVLGAVFVLGVCVALGACGGKVDGPTDGGSGGTSGTDSGASDAGPCITRQGDIGNCFSSMAIITPAACGLTPRPATLVGTACAPFCEGSVRTCAWDGTATLRCEYCR
jgi:hypothetical protein